MTLKPKGMLGWETRVTVAVGAAYGLEYLHEYATPKTYHGDDVKPVNLVLDQVSDFDLSNWSQDTKNGYLMGNRVGGIFGYPEFVASGQVTFASDVHSFGVVLLELMSRRPVVVEHVNIKDWVVELEEDDALEDVLDKSLELPGCSNGVDLLVEVVRIALRCAEGKKQDWPKIKVVGSSLDQVWNMWVRAQECVIHEDQTTRIEPR